MWTPLNLQRQVALAKIMDEGLVFHGVDASETVMHGTREAVRAHSGPHAKSHRLSKRPPFECIALLLQGGGALGSYQAGVYEALAEANLHPDWVAGISIGAIDSAIIAGNAPAERVEKLRTFWQEITVSPLLGWTAALGDPRTKGDFARGLFNQMSAAMALFQGVANFFAPRHPGSLAARGWHSRGDELLRYQAAQKYD
jgi:NTE family protein